MSEPVTAAAVVPPVEPVSALLWLLLLAVGHDVAESVRPSNGRDRTRGAMRRELRGAVETWRARRPAPRTGRTGERLSPSRRAAVMVFETELHGDVG